MPHLKSLPDGAQIFDVFSTRPEVYRPFVAMVERVSRGNSPLTRAERELIGAYVSELNDCTLCAGIHSAAAHDAGISKLDEDSRLVPIFLFVRKLTETPNRVGQEDVDTLTRAGFSDEAIHDVILLTCIAGFMNRFVFGMGIMASDAYLEAAGTEARERGYLDRFLEKTADEDSDSDDEEHTE